MENVSRNPIFMNLVPEQTCFTRHKVTGGGWDNDCKIQLNFFDNNVLIEIATPGDFAKTELCLKTKDAKDFAQYLMEFAEKVEEQYNDWRKK